jgi:hypothetical protein
MFVEKIQGIGANAGCKVCHIIIFYCTFFIIRDSLSVHNFVEKTSKFLSRFVIIIVIKI